MRSRIITSSTIPHRLLTPDTRRLVVVTGFIAGHSVLPNVWCHVGWLIFGALFCLRGLRLPPMASFAPVSLFLGWMALRSLFSSGAESAFGILSTALLVLFLILLCHLHHSLDRCGRWNGHLSALAALVSLGWHFHRYGVNFVDYRLENLLVYGGLNAVCTGLIFGFAAMWLCVLRITRWTAASALVLTTAAFCSGSRGTMLALLTAHAVLLLMHGWRKAWKPQVVLVTAFALYSMTGLLTPAPAKSTASAVAVARPVRKALARSYEGRFSIYHAGWSSLDTPWRHVIGIGQWGTRARWQQRLDPSFMELKGHLHSAFFATYVHGGLTGAALLLLVMIRLTRRAVSCACEGDARWPALLAFGITALLFDGESLAHLLTLPRFETLLFWLPATMLLAQASESSQTVSCPPSA
jgi:O-antigen ligase